MYVCMYVHEHATVTLMQHQCSLIRIGVPIVCRVKPPANVTKFVQYVREREYTIRENSIEHDTEHTHAQTHSHHEK